MKLEEQDKTRNQLVEQVVQKEVETRGCVRIVFFHVCARVACLEQHDSKCVTSDCTEWMLLFKSRPSPGEARGKDGLDAARVLPMLGVDQQRWLRTALERLYGTYLRSEILK
jgi:hypothetical protein